MKKTIFSLVTVVMLIAMTLPAISPPPVAAQPSAWPTNWTQLATDPNEQCDTFRNVVALYYDVDSQYIYLRMETVTAPGWNSTTSSDKGRYKWWFNTNGTAAYVSGTSVHGAEFLLILEDRTDLSDVDGNRDRLGEVTLMDDLGNIDFKTRWNQGGSGGYITGTPDSGGNSTFWRRELGTGTNGTGGPQGVMGADIGYRIDNATTNGTFVDMYVSRAALGDPSSICLFWATDNQNPNLDQAQNCDRPTELVCIPICIPPQADFYASDRTPCANVAINFTNNSTGTYTGWSWTFGDGGNSTLENPSHTYTVAGTYNVSLTISNGCGNDTETKENYIEVLLLPEADFYASNTKPCANVAINFTDNSTGTYDTWAWDFGDNITSGLQNPSHTYTSGGNYTVSLTISNGCGNDTKTENNYITVNPKPAANFSANVTTGCEPLAVNFTDLSTGSPTSWNWTFTGGSPSSANTQGPHTVTYTSPGTYNVTLTVTNACGNDTKTENNYITVLPLPEANFSGLPRSGCAPLTVNFTDQSTGGPASWNWTFGDGGTSTDQNPSHQYENAGSYNVTLTVSNGCGSNNETKAITVYDTTATASSNTPVLQGATIELYGGPAGMASYNWTGPNSFNSTERNPTIPNATIAMIGTYTLVVTSEHECTDDATTTVVVTVPTVPRRGGGGGCPVTNELTCDWAGRNTTEELLGNDRLAVDLLGPSPDGIHSLLLEQGTHAPTVGEKTYYLIVIRELEETPPLPENTIAIVAFNVTPEGAVFDRDIFMTLGFDQLPENALNGTLTMAYYDDVDGVWVPLESEPGEPNGVAELSLSAPLNHFTIFAVLVEVAPPPPPPPAHFVPSGLSIVTSVEKIWESVTFVTKTGESVTITANVANDGGQEGTYTVELKLNGETVDTEIVTLGAGQSQWVSFTLSEMDYGQYEVEVAGLSGEFTTSRTITWWLIIVIILAIGLIIWGVVWGRRRRQRATQEG